MAHQSWPLRALFWEFDRICIGNLPKIGIKKALLKIGKILKIGLHVCQKYAKRMDKTNSKINRVTAFFTSREVLRKRAEILRN